MGYRLLSPQLKTINQIVNNKEIDCIDLLWIKDYVQVVVWDKEGNHTTHKVDEDGNTEQAINSNDDTIGRT